MNPKHITIHCSATKPKVAFTLDKLRKFHVEKNGWSDIGYHFYITTDGVTHHCRPTRRTGAHVKGHNDDNIGICLEGGLNNISGRPDNTFTFYQFMALEKLVDDLVEDFGIQIENILGHRDWYGDANGDGVIDSRDWLKECPCFDVQEWLESTKW